MAKRYPGKILTTRAFDRREDAESFAQEMKTQYKQAEMSLKFDITRTDAGQWKATVYVLV